MSSDERPTKPQAFLALLKEGWTSLHVDARRIGIVVPQGLRGQAHLVLQYGYDLPISIPDLEVDDEGVHATLSFSRTPLRTFVPWTAVYAITCNDPRSQNDGRGVLYPEDVPPEVAVMAAPEAQIESDEARIESDEAPEAEAEPADMALAADGSAETVRDVTPVRRLRSIPASPEAERVEQPHARALPAPRRRRRPQLRLVK
ncbi:MAG TPA: ClpXP protease specificity-enhancing factor SspB [Polyangia bacterium]|nr:ClpXP protease specificity-enhancing factor SspB [Polyangia bacterium]